MFGDDVVGRPTSGPTQVSDSGFRVKGLGLRVWDIQFRVQGSGFGFKV